MLKYLSLKKNYNAQTHLLEILQHAPTMIAFPILSLRLGEPAPLSSLLIKHSPIRKLPQRFKIPIDH